jgi:PGF-pre-PGF domain-containing protein/PGF-CTERM protein
MRRVSAPPDSTDPGQPLRSVLVLCLTLALVTAPVAGVVAPTPTAAGGTTSVLDPAPTAGNDAGVGTAGNDLGVGTAGNDLGVGTAGNDLGVGTAGNDGGLPQGTVTPDPNESAAAPDAGPDPQTLDASDYVSDPVNVTLVTGTTVTVAPRPNESRYVVHGTADTETVHTDRGTYVFPTDADRSAFDRTLFNVDLLVAQNLTDAHTDSIPVIVTSAESGRVGADSTAPPTDGLDGVRVERSLPSIGAVAGEIDTTVPKTQTTTTAATDSQTVGTADTATADTTTTTNGTGSVAESLRSNDAVGRVYLDQQVQPHLDDAVNVTATYRARQQFDVTGQGVRVAVLDTGIDDTHPDIDDAVVAEKDFTGDGLEDDPDGHGTHVAGIIAGDGTASDGDYVGYAPDASVLNGRVLGSDGRGSLSDVIAGIEWAVEEDADVISMSLGAEVYGPSDPLTRAVENATDDGVTVIVSAGNSGEFGAGTISSPGIAASAITVGATDDADRLTDFSSRGPTPYAERVKPDLVAPGAGINSTCSLDRGYDCMGSETPYVSLSGTSMSAPTVSGVAALLEEQEDDDADADRDLSPSETKARLVTSTDRLPGYTVYQTGSGRLNATRALASDLRLSDGTITVGSVVGTNETATVTITNTGENEAVLPVELVVTDETGESRPVGARVTNVSGESIRLGPGESKTIGVEVNASATPGTYSARLLVGDEGNPDDQLRTVGLGWQTGIQTVTVEKRSLSGEPSDVWNDELRMIGQARETVRTGQFSRTDTVTFEVPVGTYTLASWGIDETTGQPVLLARTATVDATTTNLTLSETETATYAFDGSTLAPERIDTLGVFGGISHAETGTFDWTQQSRRASSIRVSDGPDVRATLGVLAVGTDRYDYTETDLGDGPAYSLGFSTDGVDGPETFTPSESSLSTLNYSLYRSDPNAQYRFETSGFVTGDATSGSLGASVGDARRLELRTNYDDGQFHDVGGINAGEDDRWEYGLDGDGVLPTETDGVTVNERPFTGTPEWTFDDSGGTLSVFGDALAAQGEHRAGLRGITTRVRISRNGDVVATRTGSDVVEIDREAALGDTYRVRVETGGSPVRTGPRATTILDGTNYADADGTPPSVERLDVPALGLNGGVPAERIALNLTLSDSGETVSGIDDVEVRYAPGDVPTPAWENGTPTDAWQTATVTEVGGPTSQTATLDLRAFAGDRVSIAVRVTDGNDNVVVHHAYDSLAVGTGTGDTAPPTPSLSGRIENASGVPSTNDSVLYVEDGRGSRLEAVVTNETGGFEATPDNGTVALTYLQTNYPATTPRDADGSVDRSGRFWHKRFARDGTPDLYSLGERRVDGPTELGETITLPEAGTLTVSVTNGSGAPVEDASVVVRHHAPDGDATASWRNDTNADGLFQNYMTARPGIELHGDVTITVYPPRGEGYVNRSYTHTLTMDATDERIDVTLAENATVTGRVERPDGTASSDDLVSLWNESTDSYESVTTDADGSFEAANVTPGVYESVLLQKADDGGVPSAPRDGVVDVYSFGRLDATDDAPLGTVELPRGHVLHVSVVDAWGDPAPTARVAITHDRDDVSTAVTFDTDDRGRLVAHDDGPLGAEVPRTVVLTASTESDASGETTRSLTVTEDRNVSLAVPGTENSPLTVGATPTEATAGEPIRVTLNRSRDNAPVAGTVEVNGETYETGADGAVNVTLNSSGSYEIEGQTELETGRVVTDSVGIELQSDGDGSGGGGGGGGGTPIPPAGIVDVRETDAGALVTAEKVKGGRLIRNLLPNVASDDVTVEQFSFTLAEDNRRFTAEFAASDELPSGATAPAMDDTLGYLRVETDGVADANVDTATVRFEVSRSAMEGLGAAPESVQLYRYHDGEWQAVETRHASGTTFVGVTPGFSVFAIGVQSQADDASTQTPTATPTPETTEASQRTTGSADSQRSEKTETTGPGFGPLVSLVALLAVALLARSVRRRD